ncbi:hypothetical protein TGAM01_v200348 [Trichoderma gamsii]|uniref:Autophagy-related protein 28 n=1 Tax=Trichoderma gamsii TaxID=398673 RepID=A0A2P5A303_9HYPO|nr:hypothetical protein TGAM01_v200348 [Trichoderma gamsii]PON30928.1 hypothetical protein TGAM01_v200348 [Trichoderma gamsii]
MGLFDRRDPNGEQSALPFHNGPKRAPSEHQLSTLNPRPDDASSANGGLPKAWQDQGEEPSTSHRLSPNSSRGNASMAMSSFNMKPQPMFAGPPPPISASMLIMKDPIRVDPAAGRSVRYRNTPHTLLGGSPTEANSLLLEHRRQEIEQNSDSVWRGFVSQEKAQEKEVQVLLDQQAVALVAGSGIENDASSTGSSTPTGSFFSAPGYQQRAALSLYIPPRTTRDGNVVPTRQPANDRPQGLKATRESMRKLIASMTSLKHDQSAYIDEALDKRIKALKHLKKLSIKRARLEAEIKSLADNSDEPLAREFTVIDTEHHVLGEEIQLLEAKLSRMRTRHRLLKERMDDIRNKREAGLSGYYGALNELTAEAVAYIRHPTIQPLDPDFLSGSQAEGGPTTSGGAEFMQLIPERRTPQLAASWWTAEIEILERRKDYTERYCQALEEGGQVWDKVTQLVSKFESDFRQATKSGTGTPSVKGKEKAPSVEGVISDQLLRMEQVLGELKEYMRQSEQQNWTLLICAIGAELEAFENGYKALKSMANPPKQPPPPSDDEDASTDVDEPSGPSRQQDNHPVDEESDNEVPPDLFGGPQPDHHEDGDDKHISADNTDGGTLRRYDSENEVPPEFLVEHV